MTSRFLLAALLIGGLALALLPASAGLAEAVPAAEEEGAVEAATGDEVPAATEAVVPEDPGPGTVRVVTMDDEIINRGTRDYYIDAMKAAEADPQVRALVLVLDTPGGSLQSTREIVKAMLRTELPLIVYVSPKGSRAASAGTFITMAAHVAAMAPATNIGAAHPVMLAPPGVGEKQGDDEAKRDSQAAMLEKVTNDSVAFLRNVAEQRGRNADWAEQAIRESVSIQSTEAIALKVVDLEATSLEELLAAIDGREIKVNEEKSIVLRTAGPIEYIPMTLAQRILTLLTHPNVTYLLMALAALGFYLEFNNPGMIVPGVVGAIALLLAAFGLSAIPVNLLALVFVLIGFGCLFAEVYFPSYGLLTVGGSASLAFGGVFLVKKSPEFNIGVSLEVILFVVVLSLLCVALVAWLVWKGHKRHVMGGTEGMVGEQGSVTVAIPGGAGNGRVFVHSELWHAWASTPIAAGSRVRVLEIDGMELRVEELEDRRMQSREHTAGQIPAGADSIEE